MSTRMYSEKAGVTLIECGRPIYLKKEVLDSLKPEDTLIAQIYAQDQRHPRQQFHLILEVNDWAMQKLLAKAFSFAILKLDLVVIKKNFIYAYYSGDYQETS